MLQSDIVRDDNERDRKLSEALRLTDESIKEVRTVSYLLYPPMLEEMGLGSAISWYIDGLAKRSGIHISVELSPDFGRLPREIELAIFRVLQESLTNVHRHSGSAIAYIRLSRTSSHVFVEIGDQGRGLPKEVIAELQGNSSGNLGVGLRGMIERIRQLGGTLDVASSGQGTLVRATVPLEVSSS